MGVQKRNRRNGNISGKNAAIKLFDFSGRERVHCCTRDVSPHPANNLNKTLGRGALFFNYYIAQSGLSLLQGVWLLAHN